MYQLENLQSIIESQHEFCHHGKYYNSNISKKRRRSLEHKENSIPLMIPNDKILMLKNSRPSSKHLMLTKPFWPWP